MSGSSWTSKPDGNTFWYALSATPPDQTKDYTIVTTGGVIGQFQFKKVASSTGSNVQYANWHGNSTVPSNSFTFSANLHNSGGLYIQNGTGGDSNWSNIKVYYTNVTSSGGWW